MPTLFRLMFVAGLVLAAGYGALYGVANLAKPQPRLIVEAISLPHGASSDVHTGRSVAEVLNREASTLVRPRKHGTR